MRSVGRWAGPGGEGEQAAVRLLLDLRLWGGPAGSAFRSSTRLTLNQRLLFRAIVCAFTIACRKPTRRFIGHDRPT